MPLSKEPRALWASNRVCEAAVRHKKQEQHLANLRNVRMQHAKDITAHTHCTQTIHPHLCTHTQVKPMIDNRDPRRPKTSNGKAQRLEEERNNQIMHENTILLNKLSRILTREPTPIPPPLLKHGLNENNKKADRDRIDRENQALLRRLQDVRPSVDAEKIAAEYAIHEHLINSRSGQFVANPFLHADGSGSAMGGEVRPGSRSRPRSAARPQSSSASGAEGATEVVAAEQGGGGEGE